MINGRQAHIKHGTNWIGRYELVDYSHQPTGGYRPLELTDFGLELADFGLKSTNSWLEYADLGADSIIVSRLPILNIFDIYLPNL